jgi:hypothetical protein
VGAGERDAAVRLAAFAFLREQVRTYGDLLPRAILVRGFLFEGVRVPLVGPQGIFKPAVLLDVPLSITTAPRVEGRSRPYEDDSISESSGGRAAVVIEGRNGRFDEGGGLCRSQVLGLLSSSSMRSWA